MHMPSTQATLAAGWIAANALAWAIAVGTELPFRGLWGWIACGAIVGTAQWLPLRGRLRSAPAWIAGTCCAWILGNWAGETHGFVLGPPVDPLWAGSVGGALAGVVQSWYFWRRCSWPGVWAPCVAISSILGWSVGTWVGFAVVDQRYSIAVAYWAGGASCGLVIGLVSAPVLLLMFRHPEQRQEPE